MEYVKFLDICENQTRFGTKINVPDYLVVGKYPIVDQSKKNICGYFNEEDGLYKNTPFIVFGDVTRVFKYIDFPCYLGADGSVIIKVINENYDTKYVYYALTNSYIPDTGFNRHFKFVKELEIPSYPINKQKEIVSVLDEINKQIDDSIAEITYLDELVKSRFIEMFGSRFEGSRIKLSQIANPIIGLTYKPENVKEEGTIVLRSGNILNNELQIVEDVVRVEGVKIGDNKYIQDKDILMCSRNGSARLVGKSCLIRNPKEKMSFGAFMTVIRTRYPYFLQSFFTSEFFKEQLTGVATTSVNQITSNMLNNYEVIEPSIEEEIEFAHFVEQIDKSKSIIQKRIDLYKELLEKKMSEYFD